MAVRVIPERREMICDVCMRVCNNTSPDWVRRVQEGRLIFEGHVLDMYGSPAANGNVSYDACDTCLHEIQKVINEKIEEIRNKLKA